MIIYTCPVCKKPLQKIDTTFKCTNNHSFDIAKEGYVNLMPIKSKKTKDPGDNRKMLLSRREFLESGYYKRLALNLSDKINSILENITGANILDLGCGEGYYAGIIDKNIVNKHNTIYGVDISKIAVKYGSKRYKNIQFCTASAFELPIADNSIDLLYRVYAPSSLTELNRVIKKGGYLITVTPGERHLYQLREIIYKEVLNLSNKSDESENFEKISSDNLTYTMKITEKNIVRNLLDMTPFGWKISEDALEFMLSKSTWEIESDFKIDIYKKVT
ncbi:23S rRNA (guanine(745)-N(1))-methyltransferase [Thiospirochaeta perfilievii]|uniref:23S rRNA (Guanine(745)-N(1))-methyltransferase n=1 Tax=Thiospirochaeta perfilievii TaxID=252967 RepID=A0A5C1QFX6_9SPIO|nr:23S rRNA (guanine(745)-N(1))-methyltransferase [Thiospirochaeta perfilievii]QEN06268.1 23S rRNA (guanine(745)-N(1))-methyltransferase [Thiospirochaeta perfilievii]